MIVTSCTNNRNSSRERSKEPPLRTNKTRITNFPSMLKFGRVQRNPVNRKYYIFIDIYGLFCVDVFRI
uniref:Uncharacterized protein n=1 Tax=Megaselia scalaris TaxID=36166 RepID=T1GXA0_MEGSC